MFHRYLEASNLTEKSTQKQLIVLFLILFKLEAVRLANWRKLL